MFLSRDVVSFPSTESDGGTNLAKFSLTLSVYFTLQRFELDNKMGTFTCRVTGNLSRETNIARQIRKTMSWHLAQLLPTDVYHPEKEGGVIVRVTTRTADPRSRDDNFYAKKGGQKKLFNHENESSKFSDEDKEKDHG